MKRARSRLVLSTFVLSTSLLASSATVIATSHPDPFVQAVEAIGGEDALRGLERFEIRSTGARWQDYEAARPGDVVESNTYSKTYTFDLPAENLRIDTERDLLFERYRLIGPQSFSVVLDGDVGAITNGASTFGPPGGNLPSQGVASLRIQQMLFNPHLILRDALSDPESAGDGGTVDYDGRSHRILIIGDDTAEMRLFIDEGSGHISKLEKIENHPLVRDVSIEVRYDDWLPQGALVFPNRVRLYAGGSLAQDETRSSLELEPSLSDDHFDLPATAFPPTSDVELAAYGEQTHHAIEAFFGLTGFFIGPMTLRAPSAELAPGVTLLASFANSVVIETATGLVVLEAPTSPEHGSAIVNTIGGLFPGVPITHVIQSHHHVDHASGVRSLVAAGATVVVGNGSGDFWAEVLSAESTIRPDALAAAGVTGVVEELGADGSFVIADDDIAITAYHVSANPHVDDLVITTIETAGELIVYVADLYNSGGSTVVIGGPASFFTALRDIGIIDEDCGSAVPLTIVPAHGSPQTLDRSLAGLDGEDIGC